MSERYSLVVYWSLFGNTRRIAAAVGAELESGGPVKLIALEDVEGDDVGGATLVVAGVPTHKMKMPGESRDHLDALPRGSLRGKFHAAFDTSYQLSGVLSRFTAAKKLDERLKKLGSKRLVAPETFCVVGREGPLVDGEIERARQWAREVMRRIEHRGEE